LRGRPRALPASHGLFLDSRRGRGMAERGARDLPRRMGRRGPGAQAPRAGHGRGRRSGPPRRRPSAVDGAAAAARSRRLSTPRAAWTTSRGAQGAFEDSNVREVLAALADSSPTGETRVMHAPPPPRAIPAGGDSLSDTQVLRMLEARGPEGSEPDPADVSHRSIPMLKPD